MFKCSASFWTSPLPPPTKQPKCGHVRCCQDLRRRRHPPPRRLRQSFLRASPLGGPSRDRRVCISQTPEGPCGSPSALFQKPTSHQPSPSSGLRAKHREGFPLRPGSARGPDTETVLRATQGSPSRVQRNAQAESSPGFLERRARGRLNSCTREGGPSTCKGGPPPGPSSSRSGIQRG